MSKKRKPDLYNMTMFSFSCPILLTCIGAGDVVSDADLCKKRVEFLVLSSPVRLDRDNFSVKETLHKSLEFNKFTKNFGFKFQRMDPSKFTVIINETNII